MGNANYDFHPHDSKGAPITHGQPVVVVPDCKELPADLLIRYQARGVSIISCVANKKVHYACLGQWWKVRDLTKDEQKELWEYCLQLFGNRKDGKTRDLSLVSNSTPTDGNFVFACPSLEPLDPDISSLLHRAHARKKLFVTNWFHDHCHALVAGMKDDRENFITPDPYPVSPATRQFWENISQSGRKHRAQTLLDTLLAAWHGQAAANRIAKLISGYEDTGHAYVDGLQSTVKWIGQRTTDKAIDRATSEESFSKKYRLKNLVW